MYLRTWLTTALALLATIAGPRSSNAQDDDLRKLDGKWLFVEDRTEGRAAEKGGPPMSTEFTLRVEEDAVVYPRPRGDERITLDGSALEKENAAGSITRYRGQWRHGVLEYTVETVRLSDNKRVLVIRREFVATDDGLLVHVIVDEGTRQVALYRHPEDIALPEPAKGSIADMAWLVGGWDRTSQSSSIEEYWSPPKGGAMLGMSRTVKGDKMVGYEYLRIVERESGLVYVAQPGGNPPTEFVLTQLGKNLAVFVNPRHDYPQRIVYELSDTGTLTASIGFAKGRLQSYEYQRSREGE